MNKNTFTGNLPKNNEKIDRKPWQAPVVEELDMGQTENQFAAVDDGTIPFGS